MPHMRLLVCVLFGVILSHSQTTTPFTLTEVSRQFDAAGKIKSESRFLVAGIENGSNVSVDLSPSAMGLRQIIDTARQRIILVNPSSGSASEMPYNWSPPSSETCGQRFASTPGLTVLIDPSPKALHGLFVQQISLKFPSGASGEIVLAPSLGCRTLESTISREGRVLATVVSEDLKLGEPDLSLFEVPSSYRFAEYPARD
jgi:hypothetical protein